MYVLQIDTFAVVVFVDSGGEESTDVVPSCWLTPSKGHCLWPPVRPGVVSKLVKQLAPPSSDWDLYPARCLKLCGMKFL